jgi:hypothetical protein
MCLVLQDEGEIPSQAAWLYQKGIKLLVSKWNSAKEIDAWEVGTESYRKLSVEQKEALLTEIAARKFENPENFVLFQQKEIVSHITKFLQLANHRDGIAVLKAIEAQHGLLIERADELWSFSHLTFQEYFTAQWLNQLQADQGLADKIADHRWQEVVKLAVTSQQPADRLLQLIKQAIDHSIANKSMFQECLTWVLQKSESVQTNYKPAAIRAFYFDRALDRDLNRAFVRNRALARTLACDRDLAYALARDCTLALDLAYGLALDLALARELDGALTRKIVHDRTRALDLARTHALDLAFALDLTLVLVRDHALDLYPELANKLKQLKAALPTFSIQNWNSFQDCWQSNGTQWI